MNAVFTISTPNYIGYSISLFNSLKKSNKNTLFYLVLFRPEQEIDMSTIPNEMKILYLDELELENYTDNFIKRYPINKVCFALKPLVAKKIMNKFDIIEKIIYFDSDILIYSSLKSVWDDLDGFSIVLTPHLIEALKDDIERIELRMLSRSGVFNAGFFAVKREQEAFKFLNWWSSRLLKYGLLGDQLWLNFAPTHFNVNISNNLGYNVAFYNLPNRKIKYNKSTNKYVINGKDELVFFHFVQYNPFVTPEKISTARLIQKQLTFENYPELKPIFNDYKESLNNANYSIFKKYKFVNKKQSWLKRKVIHYKNQSIRVLYKIIFEVVSI